MGKKDKKSDGLSKAERKALKAREEELAAELERREKKAKKKAGKKKAKGDKPEPVEAVTIEAEAEAPAEAEELSPHRKHLAKVEALRETIESEVATDDEKAEAQAELDKLEAEGEKLGKKKSELSPEDAAIKARVDAKRAERAAAEKPGSPERTAAMQQKVAEDRAERHGEAAPEAPAEHVAEEVATPEGGREFAVGPAEGIAVPSDAPLTDFAVNGNGQYKVQRPSDGKLVGYTRVTTYIDTLEDKSALTKWKMRLLLEGVAAVETATLADDHTAESVIARVNALAHVRDVAIAKARKADRKGKLGIGELATYIDGAWRDFKKALDALADEVFEVGGGREKAQKGTDIHALCDLHDGEGMQAVADLLTEGKITPADLADVEAYADAIRKLGAKIIESERVVVDDEGKIAGRLDRVVMVKLPGEQRARRRVLDIKTGRIDYGTGKIAMQLAKYAEMTGYDLNTHEREDLKLDRAKGIVLHLPAGTGTAKAHVVDLVAGRKGLRLAGEVRTWRSEGRRAIDMKTDLLEGGE